MAEGDLVKSRRQRNSKEMVQRLTAAGTCQPTGEGLSMAGVGFCFTRSIALLRGIGQVGVEATQGFIFGYYNRRVLVLGGSSGAGEWGEKSSLNFSHTACLETKSVGHCNSFAILSYQFFRARLIRFVGIDAVLF